MTCSRNTSPPRILRIILDLFVPQLPWVSTLYSRVGAVPGTRPNFRHLLESGELVGTFPEGTAGIGKGFWKRYQLQHWRVGHAELALLHRVPVIPVGIVGAEEQWPQVARIPLINFFGSPWLPIPGTPFPLPARIHILYGEPLQLHQGLTPAEMEDPEIVHRAAMRVRDAVRALLQRGLAERRGVFQ